MKFHPVSEEELYKLLPEGEYVAYVEAAVEKKSSKGNDMIELSCAIWDADGKKYTVKTYLAALFSTLGFCKATNQREKYDNGELRATDCQGQSVKVKIKHETDQNGNLRPAIKSFAFSDTRPTQSMFPTHTGPEERPSDGLNFTAPAAADNEIPF